MYIVAEYLFIENLVINYIILNGTKALTRTKASNKRIFFISIVLALYPFVIFFPPLQFLLKMHMKIIISILTIKLVFNSKSNLLFLKQISAFYILSFVFAGASIGLYYFNNNYLNNIDIFNKIFPVKYLILGVLLGIVMIKNLLNYYYEKTSIEDNLLSISVVLDKKKANITTLLDTGNALVEPLTNFPVFVVEYKSIKHLIPKDLAEIYEKNMDKNFTEIENAIQKIGENINIRLIPFKSIGSSSDILIGFKPDYIIIHENEKSLIYKELVIGIYNGELAVDHQYNGLLNQEIINRGNLGAC